MKPERSVSDNWAAADNLVPVPSPALLVYPDRVEENIRRMVKMAGAPGKIRPHVKTHKMSSVVKLKQKNGIKKFKCATLAEATMVAKCGGEDILLAMQPVGPYIQAYFDLVLNYPRQHFSTLTDCFQSAAALSEFAARQSMTVRLWIDINNGMNRTGIVPEKAFSLYREIVNLPGIEFAGLHVYDGHIHNRNFDERKIAVERDFDANPELAALVACLIAGVWRLKARLTPAGLSLA
jgi:D-serine deaminase-like pyridoxal phosphate-dependent protein